MNVKLVSDFRDYWDHACDADGVEFRRMTTEGPTRREALSFLEAHGVPVPMHGLVKHVIPKVLDKYRHVGPMELRKALLAHYVHLVVYQDEMAHRGEGKSLEPCTMGTFERNGEMYCTVHEPSRYPVSFRYLHVGRRRFWLCYRNRVVGVPWQSNGDISVGPSQGVTISVLGEVLNESDPFDIKAAAVLYAIDFVPSEGGLLAVDYNIAPGMKGTGIEEILQPNAIYKLIAEAVEQKQMGW
jgi:hypothetical protein